MKVLLNTTRTARLVKASCLLVLVFLLTACTGRGGGWLPPDSLPTGFTDQATFGISFSCQDSSGINGPAGRLQIELDYSDKSSNPPGTLDGPFSIHGKADTIDPVLESEICSGQNPPPGDPSRLIFLGVYRPTSSPPSGFPVSCASTISGTTTPQCRFEVIVQDNDHNHAASAGDYFSIQLSTSTASVIDQNNLSASTLPPATIFYTRAGTLGGGNITVN